MATGQGEYRAVGRLGAVIQNAGWMLGGKGVGALLSLVYLALATRSLGPEGFGAFALILGTGQAVTGFVTFQTWQIVVRYGVVHLHEGNRDRLDRLQSFCFALDVASALVGILIAALVITLLGGHFGWGAELRRDSLIFCCVLLVSITSTPVGMLRLHDRFAVAATAETVTPVMRMAGALVAVLADAGIAGFLAAWAVAQMVAAAFTWAVAIRIGGFRVRAGSGVLAENPGIRRFALLTNAGSSLTAVAKQVPTLLVGWIAGAGAAGGYRLAFQLSTALTKFSTTLSRAVFPELMRARAQSTREDVVGLFRRITILAAAAGTIVMFFLFLLGEPVLHLVGGKHYVAVYPLLLLLGGAAVMDLVGVSFEPALFAAGRAGTALLLRFVMTVTLLALLVLLVPGMGPTGAAIAALVSSGIGLIMLGLAAWRALTLAPPSQPADYPRPVGADSND